ncbi:MAG: DUF4363 family protein [Clostridiales bacterium]|nr:DUF4363 family protein [Clostridiales bacterium]
MKAIISISIVIVLFFVFSFWLQNSIQDTANDIVSVLNLIEDAVVQGDWDTAIENIESIEDDWEHTKKIWQVLIDHNEIDNIDSTFVKVKSWIALESMEDCITELATLKLFVLHVPERKALRITNIL